MKNVNNRNISTKAHFKTLPQKKAILKSCKGIILHILVVINRVVDRKGKS